MLILDGQNVSFQGDCGKQILKNITLQVNREQSVGIIGSNGCGKTTLVNCLTNLNKKHQGEITLLNKPLGEYTQTALAQKVAVMHQVNHFPFDFTVEELVEMGRYPFKEKRLFLTQQDQEIIQDMLVLFDLYDKRTEYYSQLSGGEKQRVLLARALTQTPELLVLDEPTNHLDMYQQKVILTLIKKLKLTTLSVLHDLSLAYEFCDVIYMLKNGEVSYFGETKKVMTVEHIKEVFDMDVDIIYSPKSNKKHIVTI